MKSLRIFFGKAVTSERHPGLGTDTLDYALYEEVRLSVSLSHTISVFFVYFARKGISVVILINFTYVHVR